MQVFGSLQKLPAVFSIYALQQKGTHILRILDLTALILNLVLTPKLEGCDFSYLYSWLYRIVGWERENSDTSQRINKCWLCCLTRRTKEGRYTYMSNSGAHVELMKRCPAQARPKESLLLWNQGTKSWGAKLSHYTWWKVSISMFAPQLLKSPFMRTG